jgi:hypothetical protein
VRVLNLNVAARGDVLAGDFGSGIKRFDPAGNLKQFIPQFGVTEPQDTPAGDTWTTSFAFSTLTRYDSAGTVLKSISLPSNPLGLAIVGTDAPAPSTPIDSTDVYSFRLKPNDTATISATALNGGAVTVLLLDPSGNLLATGRSDAQNLGSVINNFLANSPGSYYVRVTGSGGARYNLVVTLNADFDSESNDTFATAQDIGSAASRGNVHYALGALGSGQRLFAVADDGTSSIVELDPTTGAEIHRFAAPESVSQGPDGLAYDGNSVYYINGFSTHNLWALDPDTGAVRSSTLITAGSGSYDGLAALNGKVYITDYGFGRVLEFDPGSHTVTRTIDVAGLNPGVFLVGGLACITGPNALIATSNFGQRVVEIDLASGLVTRSFPTSNTYYGVAVENGQLYLGTPFGAVDVYARDGTFLRSFATPYGVSALGGDDVGTAQDVYRLTLDGGKKIEVSTLTPADGTGEFVNNLDLMVSIFDASGQLVATADNTATDGRNVDALKYTVPKNGGGTFYIVVAPSTATPHPTQGEYVISVDSAGITPLAFQVTSVNPPDGSLMRFGPSQVEIKLNDVFLSPTLQASDLKLDGVPATGVTIVSGNDLVFVVQGGLGDATHTIAIAPGAFQDVQGTPIQAFTSHFTLDQTPPRVVGTSIEEGDILPPGDLAYTVTFSEPMKTSNLDVNDFSLVGLERGRSYVPDSFSYDATSTMLTIHYSGLPDDAYRLTLFSGDGEFEDRVGNDLDGEPLAFPIPPNTSGDGLEGGNFFVDFATDNGTQAVPVPLVPVAPRGSLIYQSGTPAVGTIAFAGDTDDYTITLGAGQTLAVFADPAASQQVTVTLRDPPGHVIGTAASSANGAEALLRAVPAKDAGQYTITIGSTGALGLYSVRVLLNADVESESRGGGPNNNLGSAQALDPSFISLGGGRDRAAVLGTLSPSQLVTNGSFETGSFSGWSAIQTGSPFVPWTVSPKTSVM